MFKIYGADHEVIGIKNDRVIFQRMAKMDSCWDRKFPSFKINFHPTHGYFINAPGVGSEKNIVTLKDILDSMELINKIRRYYEGGK